MGIETSLWLIRHAPVDGPRGVIHGADAPADISDAAAFAAPKARLPANAGLAALPAGDVVLVVHSGTIRAVLAIALDLEPDGALRFVIDPLSLTRIDRLENGWRVVAVNQRG